MDFWATLFTEELEGLRSLAVSVLKKFKVNGLLADDLVNDLFVKMATHTAEPVGCPKSYLFKYAFYDFRKACIKEMSRPDRGRGSRLREIEDSVNFEYLDLLFYLLDHSTDPDLIQELIDNGQN